MIFLLDHPHKMRFDKFEFECLRHRLAATTAASLWIAWLSVQSTLTQVTSLEKAADLKALRILEARANTFPILFAKPLDHNTMLRIMHTNNDPYGDPTTAALISMTWCLGQRIGDVVRLHPSDFTMPVHLKDTIAITFRRFKTDKTNPPYVIFASTASMWFTIIMKTVTQARQKKTFVFIEKDTEAERSSCLHRVTLLLAAADPELEARSIRRGGLQDMAMRAVDEETILLFSRHATLAMLRRYLSWGLTSTATATKMLMAQR